MKQCIREMRWLSLPSTALSIVVFLALVAPIDAQSQDTSKKSQATGAQSLDPKDRRGPSPFLPNEFLMRGPDQPDIESGVPTREQIEKLRNFRVVRNTMVISSLRPEGCVYSTNTFEIRGFRFGDTKGSKKVFLSRRGIDIVELATTQWTDSLIVAVIPNGLGRGLYDVGIKDGGHRYISNRNRKVRVCTLIASGVAESTVVSARVPDNCVNINLSIIDVACDGENCLIVDGERIVYDFQGRRAEGSAYNILFFILDREFDQQCFGPVVLPTLFRGGARSRAQPGGQIMYFLKDGRLGWRPAGPSWHCPDFRRWSEWEVRALDDGNWGLGTPEVHYGREFWFNVRQRFATRADAVVALALYRQHEVEKVCLHLHTEFLPVQFRFYARVSGP